MGDEVVVHCGMWDVDSRRIAEGLDPMYDPSFRTGGYETTWGSFAQFTKVQAHQCMPKAPHLTWEEAAAPTLVGATAYRMLFGWAPHDVREGDVVLAQTTGLIMLVQTPAMATEASDNDEWRKRTTSLLLEGRRLVIVGNVKRPSTPDTSRRC